jgi:hypothetical protein
MKRYRRRFGDRYDGRLLRTIDPFYKIIPYIMKTRVDAQTYFEDKIEINAIEEYLKEKRKAGIKNIGFLHIVIAAMVRTLSQKPRLNRFIAGQRIYARNEILISLALKKQLHEDIPETTIKLKFKPTDTIFEIAEKLNAAITENKKIETKNGADTIARLIMLCPGFLVKLIVWLIKVLDYVGFMPKAINKLSPFHTSVFITDLGSLGIQPVYHHLYEFGTTSVFVAFGMKQKEYTLSKDNSILEKRFVNIKIVTDERIVDGYYFAAAFKLFKKLMQSPEKLELSPEQILKDIE